MITTIRGVGGGRCPASGDHQDDKMRPLQHSYTNRTLGDGVTVVKSYQGSGARDRSRRERAVLTALQGRVPVPAQWAHRLAVTQAWAE
jgi:hypothetical protein